MSKQELGFCGVDCGICPVFIATKANSDEKRKEVAELLAKKYGVEVKPEDLNCTGCYPATMNGTAIMGHCATCVLRPCAKEHGVRTCAECPEYACEKLQKVWQEIPNSDEAKSNLFAIKKPDNL